MTDLDTILRSDAEQWNRNRPAIDLDQTAHVIASYQAASPDGLASSANGQDRARADTARPARRRKGYVLAPLLSAAAVAIIAACLALAGDFHHRSDSAPQSPPPTTHSAAPKPSSSPITYRLAGSIGRFMTATAKQRAHFMANGGLTADQAMRIFKRQDPDWKPPPHVTKRYGFFTLEHGETGDHYLRTPSWAIVYPGCAAPRGPGGGSPPAGCERWVLLDAYTGHLLVISNGP